jgi:hypothetical protein
MISDVNWIISSFFAECTSIETLNRAIAWLRTFITGNEPRSRLVRVDCWNRVEHLLQMT